MNINDISEFFSDIKVIIGTLTATILGIYMRKNKTKKWSTLIFFACWAGLSLVDRIIEAITAKTKLSITEHIFAHEIFQLLLVLLPLVFALKYSIRGFKNDKEQKIKKDELYSSIFNNNHLKTLIVNPDTGDIIDCNPAACKFYGYSHEEIVKKNISDINMESINYIKEKMGQAFNDGQVYFLGKHKLASGEIREVEVFSGPIRIREKTALYSVIQDISGIQKLKRALSDTSIKFDEIFKHSKDAIILSNFENGKLSNFLEFNETAIDLLGYTKSELSIMSYYDIFQDKEVELIDENLKKITKQKSVIAERTIIAKDGSKIPVEINGHLSNFGGRTLLLFFIRDIRERKVWEEQLIKLSRALEQSASLSIITDVHGNIQYVNNKFTEVTGYTLEDVRDRNPRIIKGRYHDDKYYKEMWDTILSGKDWKGEFYNKKKSGDNYWAIASVSCIKNEQGIITNFISMQEDITEKKLYEKSLNQKNEELKDVIEKLKAAQVQIVQQEKLVGIGQLAAGVAHEINNPLGFVISNHDMLRKYFTKIKEVLLVYKQYSHEFSALDKKIQQERLNYIRFLEEKHNLYFILRDLEDLFSDSLEGFDRISEIIKSLRIFSRIDQIQEYEDYDLNYGIDTTLVLARNETRYYAVIQKDLKDIPLIYASGGEINQVLLNIIVNAAHAVKEKEPSTGGVIKISTYSDENYAYCVVEDNGNGITEENLKNIFNPFYTTKPVGEGTGLGLSISYDLIVNKHGGELIVESQVQVGTKVTIKLPLSKKHNIVC
jgi:two-component system, NtrC family, sensor kinase